MVESGCGKRKDEYKHKQKEEFYPLSLSLYLSEVYR
jgi:hypothetical protein